MSRRISFWGGLSLSLLMLGGCLLADVGIDPELDAPVVEMTPLQGGSSGVGSSGASNGAGGSSGSGSMPAAGAGGRAGSEGIPPVVAPPAAGGSGGGSAGAAGTGNMPPNVGGSAGTGTTRSPLSISTCPDGLDREQACAVYCGAYTDACSGRQLQRPSTGVLETPYDYDNSEDCARFCRDDSNWLIGNIGAFDSIMCRCHHSTLAVEQGPNPHCFHAAREPSEGGCAAPLQ